MDGGFGGYQPSLSLPEDEFLELGRPLTPTSPATKRLRTFILGSASAPTPPAGPAGPAAPPVALETNMTLDLSVFNAYHTPYDSQIPSVLPIPVPALPPLLGPLTALSPPGSLYTQSSMPLSARAPPPSLSASIPPLPLPSVPPQAGRAIDDPHAGLMREYGGVKRWCAMMRGELPWPAKQPP